MESGDLGFALLAVNPIGGLLLAIPLAVLQLGYPVWLAVVAGVPLAYVQVLVVDMGWTQLCRWPWWQRAVERRRSARIERLMASRGAFWPTVILSPLIGAWVVMAFMRYAQVPQRRVALPILLGLTWLAVLIGAGCILAPDWMRA